MLEHGIDKQYLRGEISKNRAATSLLFLYGRGEVARMLVDSWVIISNLEQQIEAFKAHQNPPRLDRATVAGLIDSAFSARAISGNAAYTYHTRNGMLPHVAQKHLDALAIERDHENECAEYLENPANATRYCTRCGRKAQPDDLSHRGICSHCSIMAQDECVAQLRDRQGPYYDKWLEHSCAALNKLGQEWIVADDDAAAEDGFSLRDYYPDEFYDADPDDVDDLPVCPECGRSLPKKPIPPPPAPHSYCAECNRRIPDDEQDDPDEEVFSLRDYYPDECYNDPNPYPWDPNLPH